MIAVNFFLGFHVYPSLLHYQAGSTVGRYIHEKGIDPSDVTAYKIEDPLNSIHFYAQGIVGRKYNADSAAQRKYVLAGTEGINELKQKGYSFDTLLKGNFFKVSELTPAFLDPRSRNKETQEFFFLKMRGPI